ncbi:MAG TPA: sialate O-acetylesterase [Sphingobacteriaceae bacterium]
MKMQKKYLLIFLCLVSISCAQTRSIPGQHEDRELDVFLLIGQSNMQGVAPIGSLDTISLKNVYLFNDKNQWEPAKNLPDNGMNRYSTVKKKPTVLFGPAYTFGRKLSSYTSRQIGLVSNARGATRIEWWQKGYNGENDFDLYEEAVERTKSALATRPGTKLKGIIWHQGEADNAETRSPFYLNRLQALVTDLRKDFGDQQISFIAGEVGKWNDRGLGVNPEIRRIKEKIPYSDWVSSDGLTSINLGKNDPHFDNYSQRVLGGRYADKAAQLIYNVKPEGVMVFSEADYQGRSVLLIKGSYNPTELEALGIPLHDISSLKIDPGYKLIAITTTDTKEFVKDARNWQSASITRIEVKKSNE